MNRWNSKMYTYLALLTFNKVYGEAEWAKGEAHQIDEVIQSAKGKLSEDEQKIVENRARRLADAYHNYVFEDFKNTYCYDEDDERYEFWDEHVSFDREIHKLWMEAVRKRQTVFMKYDSTSSGLSERYVDPYGTSTPHGEGYCHKRKEIRKFRFDRVVDIEMTDRKFEKPRSWRGKN